VVEKQNELYKMIDEFYNLVHEKLAFNFNLNDDSSEYRKSDGELTLRINKAEFYASFGIRPTILICKDITKRADEIYLELDLFNGVWLMTTDSIMNQINQYFITSILNRTIKQFTFISGYTKY
jgi:hypothetical protein